MCENASLKPLYTYSAHIGYLNEDAGQQDAGQQDAGQQDAGQHLADQGARGGFIVKKAMHFVIAGVLAAGLGIVGAGSAQATEGCSLGYACLWANQGYNASGNALVWGNSLNAGSYGHTSKNDVASSAHANGKSCKYTTWYVDSEYKGHWFYLQSQNFPGGVYKDPYLADGAGYGSYAKENFNDKISSYKFSGC